MANWSVVFTAAGAVEQARVEVACAFAHNAAKVAVRELAIQLGEAKAASLAAETVAVEVRRAS